MLHVHARCLVLTLHVLHAEVSLAKAAAKSKAAKKNERRKAKKATEGPEPAAAVADSMAALRWALGGRSIAWHKSCAAAIRFGRIWDSLGNTC